MEGRRVHQSGGCAGKNESPRLNLPQARAWKSFKIGELFSVESPKRRFNANTVKFGGLHPYVVRTSQNNGRRETILADEKWLNPGQTISFGQDTATIFYQEEPYFTGDKIKVMRFLKGTLNERRACWLIAVMRKAFSNFKWGTSSFNENVLKNVNVEAPVTDSGALDLEYIETYIRELEAARVRELDKWLRVSGLNDCELSEGESTALEVFRRGYFSMGFKIADCLRADVGDVDLQTRDVNGKGCYLINSGIQDFGIKGRTDRPAKIFSANTITIDFWGNANYRPMEYKLATHNHVFSYSGDVIKNEKVGLFLVALLKNLPKKYSYNDMATREKLQKEILRIPVRVDGEIDVDFMEKFISACMKQAIRGVVAWKDREIAATRRVVGEPWRS